MLSTSSPSAKPTLAVFDFDGTLTRHDSLLPFLKHSVRGFEFFWKSLLVVPTMTAYAMKVIPNWRAKEIVLTRFLHGWTSDQLQVAADSFAADTIPNLLKPAAVRRLCWHQQQGHTIVIVSASLEAYLKPWARSMKIEQVLGTRLQMENGQVTGRLDGKNCYGQEKVDRLRALVGDLQQYTIFAYGDSRGDAELLQIADHPFLRSFGG